jgi:hypothetical protein
MEAHADPIVNGMTIFGYQPDVSRLSTKNLWQGPGWLLKLVEHNGQSQCQWLSPLRHYTFDSWKDAKQFQVLTETLQSSEDRSLQEFLSGQKNTHDWGVPDVPSNSDTNTYSSNDASMLAMDVETIHG